MSGGHQIVGPINISANEGLSSPIKRVSRPKSFGHNPNFEFVGFAHETETLLQHLIQPPHGMARVVGIVGTGGLGKTTLAKHIYHHPQIKTRFSCRAWVCVSESWDETIILNAISRQATKDTRAQEMGYFQVVSHLYEFLSSKNYLVILDDIWCIDTWNKICKALPNDSGSRIILTTRYKKVPQSIIDSPVFIIEPRNLNDEDSFELFRRKAFPGEEGIPRDLLPLGTQMIRECKGLPLAIVALAGVLQENKSEESWDRISKKLSHSLLNMDNESTQGVVKEILALSYYELPRHLRQCVLYLLVFPEDYEIEAQKLIQMWMGECFMDEEYVAEDYLHEIAQRCIIQVVKTNYKGQVRRFRIHDLIRKMLDDMSQESSFVKDTLSMAPSRILFGNGQDNNTSQTSPTTFTTYPKRNLSSGTNSHVRSLMILLKNVDIPKDTLHQYFLKFKHLRVLTLRHFSGSEMPEEIGNLIHLRYLELAGVMKLPKSIGNLRNLWTLDLRYIFLGEWNRIALNTLYKLKELRHLYLPEDGSGKLGEIALKKGKLETLRNAVGGDWMLLGMSVLSDALQELCIFHIKSEEQLEAVFKTPSISLNNLHTLELMWEGKYLTCDMSIMRECVSLKKLKLVGIKVSLKEVLFPPNLIKLEMMFTEIDENDTMEIISESCPHLRVLVLRFIAGTATHLGSIKEDSFPQLEKLTLEDVVNINTWFVEVYAMPKLRHLTINRCVNMNLNPVGWASIRKIPQLECDLSLKFVIMDLSDYKEVEALFGTLSSDKAIRILSFLGKYKDVELLWIIYDDGLWFNKFEFWRVTGILFPPDISTLEMLETLENERQVMTILSYSYPHWRAIVFQNEVYTGSKLVLLCSGRSPRIEKFKGFDNMKIWTIKESAMPSPHYFSIKRCENMDLNPRGWKLIMEIPQEQLVDKIRDHREEAMDASENREASTSLSLFLGCFGWQ